ncbi:MAG: hypothetical protein QM817_33265 [Archangium sp.]
MFRLMLSVLLAADGGVTWNTRTVESVRVDFLDGAVTEAKWESGGSTQFQVTETADGEKFRVNVRAEKAESLEAFRTERPGWKFEKVQTTKVCGVAAKKLVAKNPAQDLQCVESTDGTSGPMHIPARKAVALVFSHRGLVVRVTLESEADRPGAHDAMFEHVLQSIRCE